MITLKEAAKIVYQLTGLTVQNQRIKSWVKSGKVTGKKILGRHYVDQESLKKYVASNS